MAAIAEELGQTEAAVAVRHSAKDYVIMLFGDRVFLVIIIHDVFDGGLRLVFANGLYTHSKVRPSPFVGPRVGPRGSIGQVCPAIEDPGKQSLRL